jgi:hypothetical protein
LVDTRGGGGIFEEAAFIPTGPWGAIADMDGDGKPDLVTSRQAITINFGN